MFAADGIDWAFMPGDCGSACCLAGEGTALEGEGAAEFGAVFCRITVCPDEGRPGTLAWAWFI